MSNLSFDVKCVQPSLVGLCDNTQSAIDSAVETATVLTTNTDFTGLQPAIPAITAVRVKDTVTITVRVGRGTTATTGTKVVGTLPEGMRPAVAIPFLGIERTHSFTTPASYIDIATTGVVTITILSVALVAGPTYPEQMYASISFAV